jgi:hypothetical protein
VETPLSVVYRNGVRGVELATRAPAYVLLASGLTVLSVALVRGDQADASGFVPSVGVGYLLVTLAGLAFIARGPLRARRYMALAVVGAVAVWLTASRYLFFSLPPGSLSDVPMGTMIALLIVAGIFLNMFAVVYLFVVFLVLIPMMTALAWCADRVPRLRRRGVGDSIRDSLRRQGDRPI